MKPTLTTGATINKPLWILVAILAILGVILAVGITRETHPNWQQQEEKWKFSSYGPWYALHQFYERQFPEAEQEAWTNLTSDTPPLNQQTQHLLFIQNTQFLSQAQFATLLKWVAAGNHVVMPVSADTAVEDMAEHLGNEDDFKDDAADFRVADVMQWANITWAPTRNWQQRAAPDNPVCQHLLQDIQAAAQRLHPEENFSTAQRQQMLSTCNQNINSIRLPEGKTIQFLASSSHGFVIKPNKQRPLLWQSQGLNGSHIARFAHGKGSLTLTTSMQAFAIPLDPRYMASDLNRLDHAYLASYLAQGKSHIWFVQKISPPQGSNHNVPMWQKAWHFSPLLSVLVLVLFGLFLWRHAFRLGGIQALNQHKQRQLSQYFRAQGEFLWQRKQHQNTFIQLQQVLWTHWQRRIPGFSLMNQTDRLQALGRIYAVSEADLKLWIAPIPQTFTAKQWLHYLQAHQNLRNAL